MRNFKEIYRNNRNGIIFTLLFHIILFVTLILNTFHIKKEFVEPELIFDFTEEIIQPASEQQQESQQNNRLANAKTNVASNKSLKNNSAEEFFDQDFEDELRKAQDLVNDVRNQLSKEIPTINGLKMPVKTNENMDPDSILNKVFSGDSNVEYFLENRYHIFLPIPVYLSEESGTVKVEIKVNQRGKVTEAIPLNNGKTREILLSYAKTAALQTNFNASKEAPTSQSGIITYHFIAQ